LANFTEQELDEFDDWDSFEDYFPENDSVIFDESEYEGA
jgi:hypothetical protein